MYEKVTVDSAVSEKTLTRSPCSGSGYRLSRCSRPPGMVRLRKPQYLRARATGYAVVIRDSGEMRRTLNIGQRLQSSAASEAPHRGHHLGMLAHRTPVEDIHVAVRGERT